MALFTPQNPQGTGDLTTHIHNTFIKEVLKANITIKSWGFGQDGAPYQHLSGSNASVPIQGSLPVDTTVLAEDSDPAPLVSSDSAALIPCNRYGDYVLLTAKAIQDKDMNTIDGQTRELAEHAMRTQDLIAGTAAVGGTNVQFKNNRADATFLVAGDVIDTSDFLQARAFLRKQLAPKFADGLYRAFISPVQVADLYADVVAVRALVEQIKYAANPNALISAEIGTFHGFRIFETDQVSVVDKDDAAGGAGAGGNTADRIRAVFMGDQYLGLCVRDPITMTGPKEAGDIMEQQVKILWKARYGYGPIKQTNGLRREYRSAFADNP